MKSRRRASRAPLTSSVIRCVPALLMALTLSLVWYGGENADVAESLTLAQTGMMTVATNALNLRSGPSVVHDVVAELAEGEVVTVTGLAQGDFLPVESGGRAGWVASQYLVESPAGSEGSVPPVLQAMEPDGDLTNGSTSGETGDRALPLAPAVPTGTSTALDAERWIRIDRSDATVSLMEGQGAVAVLPGRFGRDLSTDGFYSTAVGSFRVYAMTKELSPTPFAESTWLTDWVGFDPVRKNGIHSPVRNEDGSIREWQNDTTLGCVRLSADDAVRVFEFAAMGMRVEVVD